jgi:hypothetical protein
VEAPDGIHLWCDECGLVAERVTAGEHYRVKQPWGPLPKYVVFGAWGIALSDAFGLWAKQALVAVLLSIVFVGYGLLRFALLRRARRWATISFLVFAAAVMLGTAHNYYPGGVGSYDCGLVFQYPIHDPNPAWERQAPVEDQMGGGGTGPDSFWTGCNVLNTWRKTTGGLLGAGVVGLGACAIAQRRGPRIRQKQWRRSSLGPKSA